MYSDVIKIDFKEIEKTIELQNPKLSDLDKQKIITRCYQHLLVDILDRHISLKKTFIYFGALYIFLIGWILFT